MGGEKAPAQCVNQPGDRITPAWAGKSTPGTRPPGGSRDHPRMGGEKCLGVCLTVEQEGSPPHGRGKARFAGRKLRLTGITPAWAGKRTTGAAWLLVSEDHPRMGGEKRPSSQGRRALRGSPPHGRGKGTPAALRFAWTRITPAWAGKSCAAFRWQRSHGDHPRMGGEKNQPRFCSILTKGSPPHGRGKVNFYTILWFQLRITPAWAGKSQSDQHDRGRLRDHPRMGGEKSMVCPRSDPGTGSPPHGRGKVLSVSMLFTALRITPAWAGKSLRWYGC